MRELDVLVVSDVFLVLATRNYLQDLKKGDTRIVGQVEVAKKLGKPVFLLIDTRLTPDEEKELKTYFEQNKVIGEARFNPNDQQSMETAVANMVHILKERKRLSEPPKYPIYVNALEAGVLTAVISMSDKKEPLRFVFDQLLELQKKFREEAGVKVTELANGLVKLEDKDGNVIIRNKYEWEK
jgi:hypothetical protein